MKHTAQPTSGIDSALAERINSIRNRNKLPIRRSIMLWMPFFFASFVAAIALVPTFLRIGDGLPSALIPFVCFLPMAFYFSAQASFNEILSLEARIQELEKK